MEMRRDSVAIAIACGDLLRTRNPPESLDWNRQARNRVAKSLNVEPVERPPLLIDVSLTIHLSGEYLMSQDEDSAA